VALEVQHETRSEIWCILGDIACGGRFMEENNIWFPERSQIWERCYMIRDSNHPKTYGLITLGEKHHAILEACTHIPPLSACIC